MTKPRLLDLFCGAGGAGMGYHRAGFEVIGVDLEPQPHYPFEFIQADALTFDPSGFDAVHASPPCQFYSRLRYLPWLRDIEYWDSLPPTMQYMAQLSVPWVVENVEDAPLDGITLCGLSFGLGHPDGTPLYRHRRFASSFFMLAPGHQKHTQTIVPGPLLKNRGRLNNGYVLGGHQMSGAKVGYALGIDWMNGKECSQAIPPAYTQFVGEQLLNVLAAEAVPA